MAQRWFGKSSVGFSCTSASECCAHGLDAVVLSWDASASTTVHSAHELRCCCTGDTAGPDRPRGTYPLDRLHHLLNVSIVDFLLHPLKERHG